jgi:uncharacterized RDD family membrane protein YckC
VETPNINIASQKQEYASILQRLLAFIIDIALVSVVAIICGILLKRGVFEHLYLLYQLFAHSSKYNTSIGENIVKIHPVYLFRTEGKKTFAVRYLLLFIPIFAIELAYTITVTNPSEINNNIAIASIIFAIAWVAPMFFSKGNTALHDILSKTRLVKDKP